jgi:membrane-bound metal-dependent hydrolase YbcI (DUF457 family)
MGTGHFLSGLAAGLAVGWVVRTAGADMSEPVLAGYATVSGLSALVPDIDTPTATVSRTVCPVRTSRRRVIWAILVDPLTGGHRVRTHCLLFALLSGIVSGHLLTWEVGLFVGVGVAAGILGDWITVMGVPLLYPVVRTRYSLGWMRTGQVGEVWLAYPLFVLALSGLSWACFAMS